MNSPRAHDAVRSSGWLGVVVLAAAVITPLFAASLGQLSEQIHHGEGSIWPALGPLAILVVYGIALGSRSRVPPLVRLALTVVVTQLALCAAAWFVWNDDANMLTNIPLQLIGAPSVALFLGALVFVLAFVAQSTTKRGQTPSWLPRLVVFATANLFIFGLWLPLFCSFWPADNAWLVAADSRALTVATFGPALGALVLAGMQPRAMARKGTALAVVVTTAVLAGVAARGDATDEQQIIYAEFVPLLIAYGLFSLTAIATLAFCHLRGLSVQRRDARMPNPWFQHGVAVSRDGAPSGTPIGSLTSRGWLGGVESRAHGFAIRTEHGHLALVPPGAVLCLPIPISMCDAPTGETVCALRVGDRVSASGYVAAPGDGAYRQSPAPVPSDKGVVVYGSTKQPAAERFALLLWRPCVLFLLAIVATAVPALVGLQ